MLWAASIDGHLSSLVACHCTYLYLFHLFFYLANKLSLSLPLCPNNHCKRSSFISRCLFCFLSSFYSVSYYCICYCTTLNICVCHLFVLTKRYHEIIRWSACYWIVPSPSSTVTRETLSSHLPDKHIHLRLTVTVFLVFSKLRSHTITLVIYNTQNQSIK